MERRTLLKAGLATTAGGLLVPTLDGFTASAEAGPLRVAKVLARDLRTPWGITFLPDGSALVGERDSGRVHRVGRNGGRRPVGRVAVHSQRENSGEGGLLGLAVSPTFSRDSWLYAYISTRSDNRIVRMRVTGGGLGTPQVVLAGIPTNVHHNGGRLAFHGGLLFASTGDAENGSLAQDRGSLAGKILRMTPDGTVPQDNPFGNFTWSYGHRNVEGITFDAKGRMWASEFGEKRYDELNRIVKGGNYGWPRSEGRDGRGGGRDPLAQWATDVCSPSGVAVVQGRAFLGGLRGRCIWAVRLDGPQKGRKVRYFHNRFGRIRTVAKAPDGTLWMTTSNHDGRPSTRHGDDDRIIRLRVS